MEKLIEILSNQGFTCWGATHNDAKEIDCHTRESIKNGMTFTWISGELFEECPEGMPGINESNYKSHYFLYLKR